MRAPSRKGSPEIGQAPEKTRGKKAWGALSTAFRAKFAVWLLEKTHLRSDIFIVANFSAATKSCPILVDEIRLWLANTLKKTYGMAGCGRMAQRADESNQMMEADYQFDVNFA
jgi:hypothetical protein